MCEQRRVAFAPQPAPAEERGSELLHAPAASTYASKGASVTSPELPSACRTEAGTICSNLAQHVLKRELGRQRWWMRRQ